MLFPSRAPAAARSSSAPLLRAPRPRFVGLPYRLYYEFALHGLTWNRTANVTINSTIATMSAQVRARPARHPATPLPSDLRASSAVVVAIAVAIPTHACCPPQVAVGLSSVGAPADVQKQYWKLLGYQPPPSEATPGDGGTVCVRVCVCVCVCVCAYVVQRVAAATTVGGRYGNGNGNGTTPGRIHHSAAQLTPTAAAGGISPGGIAAAVVVPTVGVLLAAALALLLWRRHQQRLHLLTGGVRAPGAGPGTTLLITDIQSSTALWELLPEVRTGQPAGAVGPGRAPAWSVDPA